MRPVFLRINSTVTLEKRMKRWFSFPSVQIALCVSVYALVGYYLGVFAFVFALPLFATAISRPAFALLSSYRHKVLQHVWLPVHGQHYVFMGMTIHVIEDLDRCRWVSLVDVQNVVGVTANERTLTRTYPGLLKMIGQPAQMHIRDDALVNHLSKENKPAALKFRTWVERNIAFPGRTVRKRLGIIPTNNHQERD